MKTGDVIKIEERELAILQSHFDEKGESMYLIKEAATIGKIATDKFWKTLYGLYPEVKNFDININWKKKELIVRGNKS